VTCPPEILPVLSRVRPERTDDEEGTFYGSADIGFLREHEAGLTTAEVCRRHGFSAATFYKWKAKYVGLDVSKAKRLKAL
jgi:hypothetical protein